MKIIHRSHYRPELGTYWAVTEQTGDATEATFADMAEAAITDAKLTGSVGATRELGGEGIIARVTVQRITAVVLAAPYGASAERISL